MRAQAGYSCDVPQNRHKHLTLLSFSLCDSKFDRSLGFVGNLHGTTRVTYKCNDRKGNSEANVPTGPRDGGHGSLHTEKTSEMRHNVSDWHARAAAQRNVLFISCLMESMDADAEQPMATNGKRTTDSLAKDETRYEYRCKPGGRDCRHRCWR